MSRSDVAAEDMTRPELVERVRELEAAVEDLRDLTGKRTAKTNARMADIEQDLEDLQTAVASHADALASIADVGGDKTNEAEKVSAIVAYADQSRGASSKVLVTPKEIAGATGCSKRYGYDLVDKIGGLGEGGGYGDGRYPWAKVREAETVPTGKGEREKPKGLKIDFDRVQRDPDALNWFNNGSGGNGSE